MSRSKFIVALVLVTLAMAGCAGKSLFVTAVSLEAVGDQFVATTEQVTDGCNKGVIKPADCARYAEFGRRFKQVYPQTVGLWKAARAANDTAAVGTAEDVVRQLSRELTKLATEILQSFIPQEVK